MRIMKKLVAVMAVGLMVTSLAACGTEKKADDKTNTTTETSTATEASTASTDTASGSVTGSGSSALLPLAQDAADKFKASNPDITITLNAGGSGTGLKEVADGTVDIGNSDVEASAKLEAAQASTLVDHKVCTIAVATIVNKDVAEKVKGLTKQQLIDVFTGKVTNWKEVGGPDEAVVLVTRPSTSGTRSLFGKYALDGNEEASNASLETDDSGTLLQTVAGQKGAIGYVALSYLVNNSTVATLAIDGAEPTLENVYSGKYPVWGYEHMYTKGEATGAVKAYLDYVVSSDYASSIEALGYGVASKMTVTR